MADNLVWDIDVMQCGHMVERCDSYVDSDNILRMRYVCEEGHLTPWIKIKRVLLPHEIDLSGDVHLPYEPKFYEMKKIFVGDIISIKNNDYEVVFKLHLKHSSSDMYRKLIYLKPISKGENVIAEVWGDGILNFMIGEEKPLTPEGFQSWTEEKLQSLKEKLRAFTKSKEAFDK
ncbi:hypothetical protein KAU33_09060 [Candidatus Dependentiae bacterium]|nr:hypothetical protein [Candidatus Dependentiae bacterium]